jgi:hypothetical protein
MRLSPETLAKFVELFVRPRSRRPLGLPSLALLALSAQLGILASLEAALGFAFVLLLQGDGSTFHRTCEVDAARGGHECTADPHVGHTPEASARRRRA